MQAHIIAYDLAADFMQYHRNILNFQVRARGASMVIGVQVKVHTYFQVWHGAVRLNACYLMVLSKDKKISVLHRLLPVWVSGVSGTKAGRVSGFTGLAEECKTPSGVPARMLPA